MLYSLLTNGNGILSVAQETNFAKTQSSIKEMEGLMNSVVLRVNNEKYADEVHDLVMNAFMDGVQVLMLILDTLASREQELREQQMIEEFVQTFNQAEELGRATAAINLTNVYSDYVNDLHLEDADVKDVIQRVRTFMDSLSSILEEEKEYAEAIVAAPAQETDDVDEDEARDACTQAEQDRKNMAISLYSNIETATVEADTISGIIAEMLGGEAANEEIEYEYYEEDEEEEDAGDAAAEWEEESPEQSDEVALGEHGVVYDQTEDGTGSAMTSDEMAEALKSTEAAAVVRIVKTEAYDDEYDVSTTTAEGTVNNSNNHLPLSPPVKPSKRITPMNDALTSPTSATASSVAFAYVPLAAPGTNEKFTSVVLNRVAGENGDGSYVDPEMVKRKPGSTKTGADSNEPAEDGNVYAHVSLNHVEDVHDDQHDLRESFDGLVDHATGSSSDGTRAHARAKRTSVYRPDGWATQRLKRVQEMEMNDRKNGVAEAEIIRLRVTRKEEVTNDVPFCTRFLCVLTVIRIACF
jgi:hypothetical protein